MIDMRHINMDILVKTIKNILVSENSVNTHIFLPGQPIKYIPLLFSNNEEKEVLKMLLRAFIIKQKIDHYFFISEAWVAKEKFDDIIKFVGPVKDRPNKTEALIISKFSKDMKNKYIMVPFRRDGDKIVFEKEIDMTDSDTYRTSWNFYVEDVMDEVYQNLEEK